MSYNIQGTIKENSLENSTVNIKLSGKSGDYSLKKDNKTLNLFWNNNTDNKEIIYQDADETLRCLIKEGTNDVSILKINNNNAGHNYYELLLSIYSNNKLAEFTCEINKQTITILSIKGL